MLASGESRQGSRSSRRCSTERGLDCAVIAAIGARRRAPPETARRSSRTRSLKARHAARATGLPAIADDSGPRRRRARRRARRALRALSRASTADDGANVAKLLARARRCPTLTARARFHCVLVALERRRRSRAADRERRSWAGQIARTPQGQRRLRLRPGVLRSRARHARPPSLPRSAEEPREPPRRGATRPHRTLEESVGWPGAQPFRAEIYTHAARLHIRNKRVARTFLAQLGSQSVRKPLKYELLAYLIDCLTKHCEIVSDSAVRQRGRPRSPQSYAQLVWISAVAAGLPCVRCGPGIILPRPAREPDHEARNPSELRRHQGRLLVAATSSRRARRSAKTCNVEVCSSCHPFYTGKQKIVDSGGRVDKFRRRYAQGGG